MVQNFDKVWDTKNKFNLLNAVRLGLNSCIIWCKLGEITLLYIIIVSDYSPFSLKYFLSSEMVGLMPRERMITVSWSRVRI